MIENRSLYERFLRYVQLDTQSDEDSVSAPSTAKQYDLAKVLYRELLELGVEAVYDEEHCYIYGKVPGEAPALGFVAHMDTAPSASGTNVHPRLIEAYDGTDDFLSTEEFPELLHHIGEDLIATDTHTLLGADDKAGVAEIMNLVEYYVKHPEVPHREIRIAFTPDEEVGRGTENFDVDAFGAKEAYTVDGGKLGELEYECFNGAAAKLEICGKSVHTGDAKNTMINAISVGMEFDALLPKNERPEYTEGYEGFYHLDVFEGSVECAVLKYIIRDHDREKFEARKALVEKTVAFLNERYGYEVIHLTLRDQYYNMAEPMQAHMELVENAIQVMEALGVQAKVSPIRGGTDGAALTYMGIPCPNLCTGGYNFHGPYEYASVQEMETCAKLLIELVHRNDK